VFFLNKIAESPSKALIKNGIVGGYKSKLSCRFPRNKAITARWKPHPGQSRPVKYLNGQGNKKESILLKRMSKMDSNGINSTIKIILPDLPVVG
jgi:hypothetical protein